MSTEQLVVALEARIRDFERNFQKASGTANRQFGQMERRAGQAARRMETSLRSSTANINRLLGGLGVGLGFNEIRKMADAWTNMSARINNAVKSQEMGAAVMARIGQIARRTYSDIGQTTDAFVANSQALRDLGYSTQTQLDYTEALNNGLVVSNAKGQQAESVMNALAKAMAFGKLQGQNLNTVIQSGGRVAQALADGLGVTVSELRTLGAQGKLTGDVIVKALTGQLQKLREEADAMPAEIGDAITILRNAFTQYIGQLNEAHGVTAVFADGIIGLADNIDTVAAAAASAAAVILSRYVPGLARAAVAQAALVATNPFLLMTTAIGGAAFALSAFGDEIHPVTGELANLHDYAAVAWEDMRAGIGAASTAIKDTFLSAVNMIVDALGGAEISMGDLADFTKQAANNIMNAFVLVYDTIVISFTKLPAAVAEAVLNAVNRLIAGVEAGLNTVIRGVNAAVEAINGLGEYVGITLGTMGTVTLGRIENAYAGAGEVAGNAYLDALRKTTRDRVGEVLGSMRERANERAAERARRKAEADAEADSVIDSTDDPRAPTSDTQNAFEREVARIQQRIAALGVEADARRNATGSLEDQERAVRKALMVHDLLNAAQEAGVEINDDLRDKIDSLAEAYSLAAQEARELAEAQREAAKQAEELDNAGKDAIKGFIQDLRAAKSPAEALLNALTRLADKLLDMALDQALKGFSFANLFSPVAAAIRPPAVRPSMFTLPAAAPIPTPAAQTFTAPLGAVERAPLAPVADAASLGLRGSIDAAITPAVTEAVDSVTTASKAALSDAARRAAGSALGDFDKLAPQIMADLQRDLGLTREQAAGIVGNFGAETGGFKHMQELNPLVKGSKGGLGWAQWTGMSAKNPRRREFEAFAREQGLPVDSYAANYGNLLREFQGPESRALADLRKQSTVDGSTMSFLDKFERAGIRHEDSRKRWAQRAYGMEPPRPQETVPPGLDMTATGSIQQAQQQAQEQARIVQEQIEAQRRLAEQTAQATQSMQAMQPPLQNMGQQAAQIVPGLGGLGQGLSSLMGPLAQAPGATGQFTDALIQMMQQMAAQKGMGLVGGLLGFAEGGHVSGPGTSTSDSIPAMLSDGEFVVNARATKKHRAVLEAINSGKAPKLAAGGIVSRNAFSNTYAPSLNINVAGSGNARQDATLANRIADRVADTLPKDPFRRSEGQRMAQLATDLRSKGSRNT